MKLLTAEEVACILQVSKARVYELVRRRAIPAITLGERQIRFDETALRAWIAEGGSTRA
jgi:excisionase family DNA binding protein